MGLEESASLIRPLLIEVDQLPDVESSFVLPTGTVSFLLTDVAGSTIAWQEHPTTMRDVIARHYELLDEVVARHGGVRPIEQGEGDSIVAAFSRASDAIAAALDAQRAILAEPWPDDIQLGVRMAIHTGEALQRDQGNYVGTTIIRTARIRSAGHPGQILVSDASAVIAADRLPEGSTLVDLGAHRLKDLARPEQIWALSHPDLPVITDALRSLDTYRQNLPSQATPMIGRRGDLRQIAGELEHEQLVTLTGAGGVGKTRLAVQLGAELIDRYPGGVWWVSLAPLSDAAAIAPALLASIGVSEDGMRPPVTIAVDHLQRNGPAMVIFDNCEHLIEPVAELVDTLRAGCPELSVLATSREPLGVPGEITWRVPSLPLPPRDSPIDVSALSQYESVRLFLERARRARPQLVLTDQQIAAVAEICHRLDGIPLAIELAAARCRQLPPERIAAELHDRFRLLTGGSRTLLPRQQTLQASVEWSYELLTDDERLVLRRLSVFAGSFRWDAAEAVVTAPGDLYRWLVLDLLARLVDKSLVQLDDAGGASEAEYRLLETVRQFALDRARASSELATLRDAHADWWIAELERLDARQPSQESMALCASHTSDLRAALDWLDPDPTRRYWLLAHVALNWSWSGQHADGAFYAKRWLLDGPPSGQELAWAQAFTGCTWFDIEPDVSDRLCAPALELVLAAGDGRAAMASYLLLVLDLAEAPRRLVAAFELAIEQRCDRLLSGNGPFLLMYVDAFAPEKSAELRRGLADAIGRDAGPHRLWSYLLPWYERHPNVSGVFCTIPPAPASAYSGTSFTLDRLLVAVAEALYAIARPGPTDLSGALAFLDQHRGLVIADLWRNVLVAVDGVRRGEGIPDGFVNLVLPGIRYSSHPQRLFAVRLALAKGEFESAMPYLDGLLAGGTAPCEMSHAIAQAALALHQDNPAAANEHLALAAERVRMHPWPEYQIDILELLAVTAGRLGDLERSARLVGAAQAVRDGIGAPYRFPDQQEWLDALRIHDPDEWDRSHREGTRLSVDEALAYATRSRGERNRPVSGWHSLTPTEAEVARLAADGLTNPQIAERLFIGRATVKSHVSHALAKLGLTSRVQLANAVARFDQRRRT